MPEKRRSAFLRATQEAQQKELQQDSQTGAPLKGSTVIQPHSDTDTPQDHQAASLLHGNTVSQEEGSTVILTKGETVRQHHSTTAKKEEKITFYLTTEQADKLDDLAYQYKKLNGKRINRNDIVRYLIDQSSIDTLKEME